MGRPSGSRPTSLLSQIGRTYVIRMILDGVDLLVVDLPPCSPRLVDICYKDDPGWDRLTSLLSQIASHML